MRVVWRQLTALATLCVALSSYSSASAQCTCDHTIDLETTVANGVEMGVAPGDTVCVTAGQRPFLRLERFVGSPEQPVTIINCGGQVDIFNDDRAYALVLEDESRFFHVTGTGDPAFEYGFRVRAPDKDPWPGVGVWLKGKVSDYEVDHIEISDTGFAGVSAKTDPICDGSADEGNFVQSNTHLHHLYIHDTGGEGFYIGSTQSDGQTINCDGQDEVHMPHFLEGVDVHDNIIENTGWDGAQIGMARSGCRFYRNVIRNVGLEGVQYQTQGLQIGTWSACEVWGNVIEQGPANGIIVLGAGDLRVVNNVIQGFGTNGIYANDRDKVPGSSYAFLFNSIADYGENAITLYGSATVANSVANNLIVGPEPGIAVGNEVDGVEEATLRFDNRADAGVSETFELLEGSPAIGAGVHRPDVGLDLRGVARPDPPSVGAYEYLDPSLADQGGEDVWTPPLGDATTRGDASMAGGDSGGCGCRTTPASPRLSLVALLSVAALAGLRRRRSDLAA